MAKPTYTQLSFDDLEGWLDDDHQAAFDVFRSTSDQMDDPHWSVLSDFCKINPDPRQFFEAFFLPILIEDGQQMVFTGYFEPELSAAPQKSDAFPYPIYKVPEDLVAGSLFYTRREIEEDRVLADKDLEIAWLADPLDVFFLQVQGSGRISFPDGSTMRVGFGAKNGHPYTSIGAKLVARGIISDDEISADAIRSWVHENGEEGHELLWRNESYVFFREVSDVPAEFGPLGTMGRSITPCRSIAVDADIVKLGTPVWIEKSGDDPLHRLMIAQDTGSAIKGAQRADIFIGTGTEAGKIAGRINETGRMVVLLPATLARDLVAEQD